MMNDVILDTEEILVRDSNQNMFAMHAHETQVNSLSQHKQ